MLHGVKLNRESVAYFNRWVRTYRFTVRNVYRQTQPSTPAAHWTLLRS